MCLTVVDNAFHALHLIQIVQNATQTWIIDVINVPQTMARILVQFITILYVTFVQVLLQIVFIVHMTLILPQHNVLHVQMVIIQLPILDKQISA